MQWDLLSSKTLDYDYMTNRIARICCGNNEDKGIIVSIDDRELCISISRREYFKKNSFIKVQISYKGCLIECLCKIESYEDGLLYLDMPRQAKRIQKRDYLRVSTNIKCQVEEFNNGVIKNISGGGVYLFLNRNVDEISNIGKIFKIVFVLNNKELRLNCEIVEAYKNTIRAKFINISKEAQQFITDYCCRQDAILYRESHYDR